MDSIISGAEKLFLRGKYSKVLRMLEPQVFQYRDSYRFYLLLGYSCLYTGDFGGAYSYLRRAEQLSHGDIPANLGIALIHSKRGETESAIRIWLDILERNNNSREAQRGLKLIRESRDFSEISLRLEDGKLDRFLYYPRRKKTARYMAAAVIIIVIITAGLFYFRPWDFRKPALKRPEIARINFYENSDNQESTAGVLVLDENEVEKLTVTILELMDAYRDNLAMVEINRLLLSNAPDNVKDKALYLSGLMKPPDFANLKDNFSYREVAMNPRLYSQCYVIWRGKPANINIQEDTITFDLLVGYESETILEAIVPVILDFPIELTENRSLEILGQIELLNSSTYESPVSLKGISVHQLLN